MADDVTLLPCPFCGGTPYVNDNDIWTYMECECGAQGPQADTKAEAREVWNSRVSDPRIAALEAQLAEARDWSSTLADAADDLRAELRDAQEALSTSGIGGIYDTFKDVGDAIRQMAAYIKERDARIAALEAEVAALQERRCETCIHGEPTVRRGYKTIYCPRHDTYVWDGCDFGCIYWQGEET